MATLVLSAVGTAIGGPLGGALGALAGNQLDRALAGSPKREGPRLKELAVTTSTYGSPIPRHYGRVRASGTVIWATDLKEMKEKTGGTKGSPSISSYSYSISFAVALASRPVKEVRRIWADGSLLRGSSGDLKVGGHFRLHRGHGDQMPDPLIASDQGGTCPAFRNRAYCVFEDLQLAEFGNRIPALTFELVADDGEVSISQLVESLDTEVAASVPSAGLIGFSDEGGPLVASIALLDQLFPMTCEAHTKLIRLTSTDFQDSYIRQLPEPAILADDDGFGGQEGYRTDRNLVQRDIPEGIRYYEIDRDYQPGLQRATGRARFTRSGMLDFPGVLAASVARQLCHALVQRIARASDQIFWRVAELDPALKPGQVVRVPGKAGFWRIQNWEWRVGGVELELQRVPAETLRPVAAEAGELLAPRDAVATPTLLTAFELPWNGSEASQGGAIFAALSSTSDGWTGAAIYHLDGEALTYLQPSGSERSVIGSLSTTLPTSPAILFEPQAWIDVDLIGEALVIQSTTPEGLVRGDNLALVGNELLQFLRADIIGERRWRLSGLLRGRGGTEAQASVGNDAGSPFVLIDEKPVRLNLDLRHAENDEIIAAIGLADTEPAFSKVHNAGLAHKPLSPVHAETEIQLDGSARFKWTKRSPGNWTWSKVGETPLMDDGGRYLVGVGNIEAPALIWETLETRLTLSPEVMARLRQEQSGRKIWVRQVGEFSSSDEVCLWTIKT